MQPIEGLEVGCAGGAGRAVVEAAVVDGQVRAVEEELDGCLQTGE